MPSITKALRTIRSAVQISQAQAAQSRIAAQHRRDAIIAEYFADLAQEDLAETVRVSFPNRYAQIRARRAD